MIYLAGILKCQFTDYFKFNSTISLSVISNVGPTVMEMLPFPTLCYNINNGRFSLGGNKLFQDPPVVLNDPHSFFLTFVI